MDWNRTFCKPKNFTAVRAFQVEQWLVEFYSVWNFTWKGNAGIHSQCIQDRALKNTLPRANVLFTLMKIGSRTPGVKVMIQSSWNIFEYLIILFVFLVEFICVFCITLRWLRSFDLEVGNRKNIFWFVKTSGAQICLGMPSLVYIRFTSNIYFWSLYAYQLSDLKWFTTVRA